MQFPKEDEEGDFNFNAGVRSRLSSLFVGDGSKGDVNQALTFTAPKQPKKTDPGQNNPGEFKVLATGIVNAFKLIDGSYASQGKLGCAVLGIHENAIYQLLLYKAKKERVMACKIHPSFKFTVQSNNYVNFYDDVNQNWSINFGSEETLCEIAKQVAIAKANCEGKNPTTLVVQNLTLGDGAPLDKGDSVEVKYTGWLLSNFSIGQVFDSNMKSESCLRVRLGKSKVIKGWHEGLLGVQKGCKRLIIVPPSLGYGSEGMGSSVPPNSTLIFEVHVVKVKLARESSHSPSPKLPDAVPEKKPEVTPRSSFCNEDNIRLRGASISEQLTQSPKKDKAQLISRMAKMGTATLPFQGAIPARVSVSSDEEDTALPESPPVPLGGSRTASPKPSLPRSRNNSGSVSGVPSERSPYQETVIGPVSYQPMNHSQQNMVVQQPFMSSPVGYPGYQRPIDPYQLHQAQYPVPIPTLSPSIADTHMPLLITESRTQNAEVRLSLSKVSDKVDTVIQKIDELKPNQGRSSNIPILESSILVQNIERIIQENNLLKDDAEAKNAKIQVLNDKIHDLFQRNQRFYEENSSTNEQKIDSSLAHAKLTNLEKENSKLIAELAEVENKIKSMESEMLKYKNQEVEYNCLLEQKSIFEKLSNDPTNMEELIKLQTQLMTVEEDKKNIAAKLKSLEKQIEIQLNSEKTLKKQIEKLEAKLESTKTAVPTSEMSKLEESYEKQISSYKEQLKELSSSLSSDAKAYREEVERLKIGMDKIMKEKDDQQFENQILSKKLNNAQSALEETRNKFIEHETELQQALLWKQKYENFHQKTRALKESYDNRISELTLEIKQLQEARSNSVPAEFTGELKKVMNALYRILQGRFDLKSSYEGSQVLEITLQSIKALTLRMLEMKGRAPSNSSEKGAEPGRALAEKAGDSGQEVKTEGSVERTGGGDSHRVEECSQLNGFESSVCDIEDKASGDSPSAIKSGFVEPELPQSDKDCGSKTDYKPAAEPASDENTSNQNEAPNLSVKEDTTEKVENPSKTSDLSVVSTENKVETISRDSPESTEHSSNLIEPPPLSEALGNKV